MYYKRIIDEYLLNWAQRKDHKPLLLRGARQTGKSALCLIAAFKAIAI